MGSYVKMLLWVAILTLGFGVPDTTDASIASYVKQICERMPIHTTAPRTAGDNGFRIIIEGLPTADTYRPGETYTGKVFTFVCEILVVSVFVCVGALPIIHNRLCCSCNESDKNSTSGEGST